MPALFWLIVCSKRYTSVIREAQKSMMRIYDKEIQGNQPPLAVSIIWLIANAFFSLPTLTHISLIDKSINTLSQHFGNISSNLTFFPCLRNIQCPEPWNKTIPYNVMWYSDLTLSTLYLRYVRHATHILPSTVHEVCWFVWGPWLSCLLP